jgi:hypothetical protein
MACLQRTLASFQMELPWLYDPGASTATGAGLIIVVPLGEQAGSQARTQAAFHISETWAPFRCAKEAVAFVLFYFVF